MSLGKFRWWLVLGVVAVLALLGVMFYRLVWSASLTITAAPYDVAITVNGTTVENKKTRRWRAGEYLVRLEREGFDAEEHLVVLKGGDATELVYALLPSDGDYQWYLDNAEDGMILDTVMSGLADAESESLLERFPILEELPYRTNFYELVLFALPSSESALLTLELTIFEVPRDDIYATPEKFALYSAECRAWLLEQGLGEGEFEIVSGNGV
ncbi:MAG: hypothetical protein LBM12_01785 [Candidatus Nomurabacteria bacterium]|nr:hypothetical protein [Candidatus Nomurabacteria bacterium]